MKKVQIALAALAFVATAGIATATAGNRVAIDCSEFPNQVGQQIDRTTCDPGAATCCYLLVDNTPIQGTFPQ